MRRFWACPAVLLLAACDLGALGGRTLSVQWQLRYGDLAAFEPRDLPETTCDAWDLEVVDLSLRGPYPVPETDTSAPCQYGTHEFRSLEAGDYVVHVETGRDGMAYFFAEETVTVEGGDTRLDLDLVPLIGLARLSWTADASSGSCEGNGVDAVDITFEPLLGEQGGYPTAEDVQGLYVNTHQVTDIGEFQSQIGLDCLTDVMEQAFGGMSQRGYLDPSLRPLAVQGIEYEISVVGLTAEAETHTAPPESRRIRAGASPPEDLGVICLDPTGSCD